jgi:hypothetical protein
MKTKVSHGSNTDGTRIYEDGRLALSMTSIRVQSVFHPWLQTGIAWQKESFGPMVLFVLLCFRDRFMQWSFGLGIVGLRSWLVIGESFDRKLRLSEPACDMGRHDGQGCKSDVRVLLYSRREQWSFYSRETQFLAVERVRVLLREKKSRADTCATWPQGDNVLGDMML